MWGEMERSRRHLWSWFWCYALANTLGFLLGQPYAWFPLVLMAYHYGRMTAFEDAEEFRVR